MGKEKEIFELLNSEEFYKIHEYYGKPTVFDILGVSRREVSHSNFIAWLLSPKESHSLGDYAIRKLLEIRYNELPESIKNEILTGNYEILKANVSRELKLSNQKKNGFLDVFIALKIELNGTTKDFYIIIENKVESTEGTEQTKRYQEWFDRTYKDAYVLMLYLSANNNDKLSGEKFINITYKELSNQLLSYCVLKATDENTKKLIQDYICCLSQPLITGDDDLKHEILAINENEIHLVNQLLNKHKDILFYIIDELLEMNNKQISQIYKLNICTFKGIFNVMLLSDSASMYHEKINKILENKVKKFKFNGKEYKRGGRNHNSVGYLVREMISVYSKSTTTTYKKLKELLESQQWLSPWVDEIITNVTPGNIDHFFMMEEDVIKIGNDAIFIAKYWTSSDALKMANLLNQELKSI